MCMYMTYEHMYVHVKLKYTLPSKRSSAHLTGVNPQIYENILLHFFTLNKYDLVKLTYTIEFISIVK